MADIINAPDLPSDDEEDDDYDPSRDADKGDEPKARSKSGPTRKNKRALDGSEDLQENEEEDLQHRAMSSKTVAKKAKTDALWAGLSGKVRPQKEELGGPSVSARVEGKGSKPSMGINWGSLCRPVAKATPSTDKNRSWMLQLGFSAKKADGAAEGIQRQGTGTPGNNGAISAPSATADEPAKAVEPNDTALVEAGSLADHAYTCTAPGQSPMLGQAQSSAAAALAAARAAASGTGHGQVSVMETRRFAGKDIQVSESVSAAESAAQAEAEAKQRNKAGLDSVLASLQAAKKVNVLDKSRSDWREFKTGDTKVEDELEAYKKSNDKYLDKVDFLKRAELRQYEKERDARLGGDIRSRARL